MKTKIIKQKNQQFLCMKLGRKEQFDVKELELLSVRAVPGLLCPVAVQGRQNNLIEFDVSLYTSLRFYLTCIQSPQQFADLANQCVQIFKRMREVYLKPENLLGDLDQIYVMLSEKRVEFLYAPLMGYTGPFSMERFFRQLAEQAVCGTYDFVLFKEQYLNFLSRPSTFSLREFEAFLSSISSQPGERWWEPKPQEQGRPAPYVPPAAPPPAVPAASARPGQAAPPPARPQTAPPVPVAQQPVPPPAPQPASRGTGTAVLGDVSGRAVLEPAQGETMPLTAAAPLPTGYLLWQKGNLSGRVGEQPLLVGSSAEQCGFLVPGNRTISRRHALLTRRGPAFFVKDCGSRNGTFLNGRQLEPEKEEELRDGDRLRLSDEDFLFRVDGGTEERR